MRYFHGRAITLTLTHHNNESSLLWTFTPGLQLTEDVGLPSSCPISLIFFLPFWSISFQGDDHINISSSLNSRMQILAKRKGFKILSKTYLTSLDINFYTGKAKYVLWNQSYYQITIIEKLNTWTPQQGGTLSLYTRHMKMMKCFIYI